VFYYFFLVEAIFIIHFVSQPQSTRPSAQIKQTAKTNQELFREQLAEYVKSQSASILHLQLLAGHAQAKQPLVYTGNGLPALPVKVCFFICVRQH